MDGTAMSPSEAYVIMYTLKDSYSLCGLLNDSPIWEHRTFHVLAALYGIVSVVTMVTHEARTVSTDGLRPAFFITNGIVYAIQDTETSKTN
ncbi:hypothetical protein L6452_06333 [Arctium lappa]|uniref:Uncharacterized protein n=1 Tax=Arctium lappa TaxID=4217 RepID=A0ACB9EJ84_ARCLA|nr:hypothetical protein L6452_06333 [Arctium lappa]